MKPWRYMYHLFSTAASRMISTNNLCEDQELCEDRPSEERCTNMSRARTDRLKGNREEWQLEVNW
jgi:hypothetical protein